MLCRPWRVIVRFIVCPTRSFKYKMNSRGPKFEPWSTPILKGKKVFNFSATFFVLFVGLLFSKAFIHSQVHGTSFCTTFLYEVSNLYMENNCSQAVQERRSFQCFVYEKCHIVYNSINKRLLRKHCFETIICVFWLAKTLQIFQSNL